VPLQKKTAMLIRGRGRYGGFGGGVRRLNGGGLMHKLLMLKKRRVRHVSNPTHFTHLVDL